MAATAPSAAPPPPAGAARTGARLAPAVGAAVALLAVVLGSGVGEQVVRPFIRRDDWPYLLPAGAPGASDALAKVEQEGRWLGWVWWWLVGQHGTPTTAAVVFVAAWVVFSVGVWRLFRVEGTLSAALLLAALVVSPLWIRLVYWPGSLSGAAVVAAAAVWALPPAARRRRGTTVWVVAVGALAVLTYPPMGGLLLVAAAVHLRHRPWRDLTVLCGGFLVGFALGVAVTVVANLLVFGHAGPDIAAWRRPNLPADPGDLLTNAKRHLAQLRALVRTLGPACVVGLVAGVWALADRTVRPVALRVGLALAVVAGLEAVQTLATGVRTNVRGQLWGWAAATVPAALLLGGSAWTRRAGQALLLVLAAWGVLAWRSDVATHQETRRAYDSIVDAAVRVSGGDPGRQVVFQQDPAERRTARGRITEGTLRMMFYEQEGVVVRWCRGAECARLAGLRGRGPVHDLGTVTGVVVPSPPRVL